jgi:hypothetical protein
MGINDFDSDGLWAGDAQSIQQARNSSKIVKANDFLPTDEKGPIAGPFLIFLIPLYRVGKTHLHFG